MTGVNTNILITIKRIQATTITFQPIIKVFDKSTITPNPESKFEEELFDLDFRNIEMTGVNTKILITDKRMQATTVTLQPIIKVFDDRTVTPNPASKVGKYPQQLLQKVKFPVNINKLIVKNG